MYPTILLKGHLKKISQGLTWWFSCDVFNIVFFFILMFFIKHNYVIGAHLNCIKSMQFKWVPTTYAFIKKKTKITLAVIWRLQNWLLRQAVITRRTWISLDKLCIDISVLACKKHMFCFVCLTKNIDNYLISHFEWSVVGCQLSGQVTWRRSQLLDCALIGTCEAINSTVFTICIWTDRPEQTV